MGGVSSNTYSQELKNPTRTLRSTLTLNPTNNTFLFIQDMRKGRTIITNKSCLYWTNFEN